MENFVVSARKYRPATFDTVVGQASITTTLKNALRSKHLAQAFLFCGPRGVGKTTSARILAKTINCEKLTENMEACNECDSCQSFNSGHSLNIFELDAASNNSVDDIRNLISQVSFAPQLGNFKVYIIDEIHMLSANAFNAFLKTLEEPPKHAVFILATTEKHKIIPTILSRCQIFDFSRIQVKDIAAHLEFIAKNEHIDAEPDALHIIAQKADGSLRDALSMFDQLVSFAGKNLTYESVINNLNVLDYDYYFKVTDEILQHRIPASLLIFNEILNKGFDGHNFMMGLSEHFRNLLVCKDASTVQLLEVSDNIKTKYLEQSQKCAPQNLLTFLEVANQCDIHYKTSKNQRLLVELSLMQLCSVDANNGSAEKKKSELKILPPPSMSSGENASVSNEKTHLSTIKTYHGKPGTIGRETISEQPPLIVEERAETYQKANIPNGNSKLRLNTKSYSISGTLQPNSADRNHVTTDLHKSKKNQSFTEIMLIDVWNKYAHAIKQQGKESLYSIFAKRNPQLKSENVIELVIDNTVMETAFIAEKPNLMEFLQKELNNYFLEINIIVNKNVEQRTAYTNREKFIKLAEKNPLLLKLRQQLDLEVL